VAKGTKLPITLSKYEHKKYAIADNSVEDFANPKVVREPQIGNHWLS
jgi:hypothetical protein